VKGFLYPLESVINPLQNTHTHIQNIVSTERKGRKGDAAFGRKKKRFVQKKRKETCTLWYNSRGPSCWINRCFLCRAWKERKKHTWLTAVPLFSVSVGVLKGATHTSQTKQTNTHTQISFAPKWNVMRYKEEPYGFRRANTTIPSFTSGKQNFKRGYIYIYLFIKKSWMKERAGRSKKKEKKMARNTNKTLF